MPALPPEHPGCPRAADPRPLPDPTAIRLCRIPDSDPPYDTDRLPDRAAFAAEGRLTADGDPAAAGPGGLDARRPGGHEAPGTAPDGAGPGPAWPARFAQILAETLAGARPARQIVPWTTERARRNIQRLGPQLSSRAQPRVQRVITFRPQPDVLELAVVVGFGAQVRALAIRLERAAPRQSRQAGEPGTARWLCTAVEAA